MKYVGSKNKLSKELVPIIQSYISSETCCYLEPFVGGANMIDKIKHYNSPGKHSNSSGKLKVLFLAPHLSTGGMPSFLLKRIEELSKHQDIIDMFVVEFSNLSDHYVVQKNRIKELIEEKNAK